MYVYLPIYAVSKLELDEKRVTLTDEVICLCVFFNDWYVYAYVCMHVCMFVCMYACMYVCIYLFRSIRVCVCVCVCVTMLILPGLSSGGH